MIGRVVQAGWIGGALGLALAGPAWSGEAEGPAFDCSRAEHAVEELICGDAELAAEDRALAEVYARALERLSGEQLSFLRTEQRGWVKGRNDCWKAEDPRACTLDAQRRRRAELSARYGLVLVPDPVRFSCVPEDVADVDAEPTELLATFFDTDPRAVNLVRGDEAMTAVATPTASGARYEGSFGSSFWTQGDEAMLEWPEGTRLRCRVEERP